MMLPQNPRKRPRGSVRPPSSSRTTDPRETALMSKKINMPDLPRGAVDGTLRRWLKAPGDVIAAGDVVAEVEIDRAVVELEA
ncbi:MAG TPA: lipoyl domain-containing protein, partial [Sumerlaeia bacterium]|nr:lipoyl domain-containing protein [Sumerlaeia bacterium]